MLSSGVAILGCNPGRFGFLAPLKNSPARSSTFRSRCWRLHPGKWPYPMLTLDVSMVLPISRNLPGQWSTTSRSTPTRSKHWHSQRSVASSFAGFTVGVHAFVWRRLRVANIQWPEDSSRCFCCLHDKMMVFLSSLDIGVIWYEWCIVISFVARLARSKQPSLFEKGGSSRTSVMHFMTWTWPIPWKRYDKI